MSCRRGLAAGAGNRARTGTRLTPHGILSPGCLPISPFRHISPVPIYFITSPARCQPLSEIFLILPVRCFSTHAALHLAEKRRPRVFASHPRHFASLRRRSRISRKRLSGEPGSAAPGVFYSHSPPFACRRSLLPTPHAKKRLAWSRFRRGGARSHSRRRFDRLCFCSPSAVFRRVTISASRRNVDPAFSHPLRDISTRSGGGRGFPANGSPASAGRRRPVVSILTRRLSLAAERSSSLAPAKKRLPWSRFRRGCARSHLRRRAAVDCIFVVRSRCFDA